MILPIWYLEESTPQKQKVEWWLPGAGKGENGELVFNGAELPFGKVGKFWRRMTAIAARQVNVLNATENG